MRVFLSFSGPRSNAIASALYGWLPQVFQDVVPFFSEEISAGARWGPEISQALEETHFAILCLTPENVQPSIAPWLAFEAGAVAKSIDSARVVPFLTDLAPSDVPEPLGQFQGVSADSDGVTKLVASVNEARVHADLPIRSETSLHKTLQKWLPDLLQDLGRVDPGSAVASRSVPDMLEEVLDGVRSLLRAERSPSFGAGPSFQDRGITRRQAALIADELLKIGGPSRELSGWITADSRVKYGPIARALLSEAGDPSEAPPEGDPPES